MQGYNEDIIFDGVVEYSSYLLKTFIIISLILCTACYRWRYLANSFLYLEICIRICATLVPNASNEQHTHVYTGILSVIMFICFYCDKLGQLVVLTLHLTFALFFGHHVVYQK